MDRFILLVSLITVGLIVLISFMDMSKSGYFIQNTSPLGLSLGVSLSIAAIGALFAYFWGK